MIPISDSSTLSSKWRRLAMHLASLLIIFIAAVFVFLYDFVMLNVIIVLRKLIQAEMKVTCLH